MSKVTTRLPYSMPIYVIHVTVGRSYRNCAVLADKAVFPVTRLVIPRVTVFLPQIDACLMSTTIVWLSTRMTSPPVGVAHGMTCEHGVMWDCVVICPFPYELWPGFGVFPLSCRPYVDSVRSTSITRRPLVVCKHSTSMSLQLSKYTVFQRKKRHALFLYVW